MRNKLGAIVTCLVLGAMGAFVLHKYEGTGAMVFGGVCIFLMLGIAFPTNLHTGVSNVGKELQEVKPLVEEIKKAVPGGN